jgi:hypothetical protein
MMLFTTKAWIQVVMLTLGHYNSSAKHVAPVFQVSDEVDKELFAKLIGVLCVIAGADGVLDTLHTLPCAAQR